MIIKNMITKLGHQYLGKPAILNENISLKIIKKYLPQKPTIIDCGAHNGSDSLRLQHYLDATVYSFEPIPRIFNELTENTKHNNRIYCYNIALSDEDGFSTFFVSSGESEASSSLLEPKEHLIDHPMITFREKIIVKTMTLDSWAMQNSIAKVDMLWLDMQGYEMQMLMSSQSILPNVKVIHTEVSTKKTYEGVKLYPEYRFFLSKKGFEVKLEAIPDKWDMGNVLFVRKQK